MVVVATKWTGSFMASTFISNTTGDMSANDCNTISSHPLGFKECYWTNSWKRPLYITKSCYEGLTEAEKAIARSAGRGMVKDSGWYTTYWDGKTRYKLNPDAVIPYPDICEGVVCDDTCIGADKYSQECMTEGVDAGKCVFDELIEANHPDCPGYVPPPPDPCEGVVCDPVCDGDDLYATECEAGTCRRSVLIEEDSAECGYVPPDPDPDPDPEPEPEPEPSKTPWALLGAALIGLYLYLKS